jgi:hypothetical protein
MPSLTHSKGAFFWANSRYVILSSIHTYLDPSIHGGNFATEYGTIISITTNDECCRAHRMVACSQ